MMGTLLNVILSLTYEEFYKSYREAEALFFAGKYDRAERIYRRLLTDARNSDMKKNFFIE